MALRSKRRMRVESGFIIPTSLFLVFILITFIGGLMVQTAGDLNVSERTRQHEQAFQIAEAGLDHALITLSSSSIEWTDDLRGPDGLPDTADDHQLPFGPTVAFGNGFYDVRLYDNDDEIAPDPNDPLTDVDGVIRLEAHGTMLDSARSVIVHLWALFNHAIAADINVALREASVLGNVHANHDIEVYADNTLAGNSQITASGAFTGGGDVICSSCDTVGGDPEINFPEPRVSQLEAAVDRWNPATWNATVGLVDGEIAGYRLGHDLDPETISLTGQASLVVFDGDSIRFRDDVGPAAWDPSTGRRECTGYLDVNIIALGGGSITFDSLACIRGLLWAEGDIVFGERSRVSGAVVSSQGSVDVGEKSQITFNRDAIEGGLLPGFWGFTVLTWNEEPP